MLLKRNLLIGTVLLLLAGNTALPHPPGHKPDARVQIALLLDTSNSMDGLINQAKATLWDLVNEFTYVRCRESTAPELEIALYEYGNDGLNAREGYIRQVLPFSRDLDEISRQLFSLRTNGGEEYCGQVIQTALRQLAWSRNPRDLRFVFIAGNEPFNQGRVPYEAVLSDTAEKDVVVNTIFCGNYELGVNTFWADGARLGHGRYTAIDHNRAIVHVATPFDDIIIRLNRDLNQTYIAYGRQGASKKQLQATQDENAAEMDQSVMVGRAVSKSSSFYKNSSWDLVDAYTEGGLKVEALERESLPESLRGMKAPQLQEYLMAQQSKRTRIQEEIRKASARREAYLAQNSARQEADLQQALISAVRKQAEKKQYHWIEK